eukprot:2000451-Alexandrium_andersonii.AAC.1
MPRFSRLMLEQGFSAQWGLSQLHGPGGVSVREPFQHAFYEPHVWPETVRRLLSSGRSSPVRR